MNNYYIGVGRRKEATARVYLKPGLGKHLVRTNQGKEKSLQDYFYMEPSLYTDICTPLTIFGKEKEFDFFVRVNGSGYHSQAEAIRLGIARAILKFNPEFKNTLKNFSLLTRDPRKVERKKIGFRKSRKKEQYAKR
jgi:small subunit ribosomal protein S9